MAKAKKAAPKASSKSDNGKTFAIVAHIGWLGWILALVLDKDRDPLARFYIRQTLILYLAAFICWIPFIGWIIGLAIFIFWIISLIGAINGEQKEVPVVGKLAQDWFKGL
jgi:uncharacterized membrane protein